MFAKGWKTNTILEKIILEDGNMKEYSNEQYIREAEKDNYILNTYIDIVTQTKKDYPDGKVLLDIGNIFILEVRGDEQVVYKIVVGTTFLSINPDTSLFGDGIDKPSILLLNPCIEVIWGDRDDVNREVSSNSLYELEGLVSKSKKLDIIREAFEYLKEEGD